MARIVRAFRSLPPLLLAAACAVTLSGCGGDDAGDAGKPAAEAPLPRPQQAGGSITGMPAKPGPGGVPLAGEAPPPPPALLPADERFGLPALEDNPETGLADAGEDPAAAAEPAPADAVAVLRDYYAAIDARDFARAYALWSDGGRASGQTPEQFAAGFAETGRVTATVGDAGPVEGAAGSRYIEVPVAVNATLADGSLHRFAGRYTLRRAVVDGATPEQRAWRIASADLREAAD